MDHGWSEWGGFISYREATEAQIFGVHEEICTFRGSAETGCGEEGVWLIAIYLLYAIAKITAEPIKNRMNAGGGGRNRTGVHGFAGRCITTLPPRLTRPTATVLLLWHHCGARTKSKKGKRIFLA